MCVCMPSVVFVFLASPNDVDVSLWLIVVAAGCFWLSSLCRSRASPTRQMVVLLLLQQLLLLLLAGVATANLHGNLNVSWDARGNAIFEAAWKTASHCADKLTVRMPIVEREFVVCNTNYQWFWGGIGQWEQHTFQVMGRFIDSNTVVVDFGAWVGESETHVRALFVL